MITARFIAEDPVPGPGFLDLLDALAGARGEQLAALHSAGGGRWSVIGVDPIWTIDFSPEGMGRWIAHQELAPPPEPPPAGVADMFDAMLASVHLAQAPIADAPMGWLGWVSYDIGRHLETMGASGCDDMGWPLLRWTLFGSYYLLDHTHDQWTRIAVEVDQRGGAAVRQRLDGMAAIMSSVARDRTESAPAAAGTVVRRLSHADYCAAAQRVLDYIGSGDVYQVNLAQRWTIDTPEPPEHVFRRLCQASPAAYAAYFRFADRAIASASPELFLQRRGAHLLTRPIKGTRPRNHQNAADDLRLQNELWESPKDKAELAMIVDLLRNDLGRICRYGSIKIVQPRQMERHPTLWHTAASIQGQLSRGDLGWGGIMAALCPGGSITGTPKIRAMQIIAELEEFRRGVYCGNLGWIGPQGAGCWNIAIRTLLLERREPNWHAWAWAGGGIVADSAPEAEWRETLHKVAALFAALGVEG